MLKLLKKLKGKLLDEARYELLRQAVEFQQEKLELMRIAVQTLQENNDLLKENIRRLEQEISRMRRRPDGGPVPSGSASGDIPQHIQEISDMTVAILLECRRRNPAVLDAAEMTASLSCDPHEVERPLAELVESGLVRRLSARRGEATYRLTPAGRSYAQTLSGGSLSPKSPRGR